MIAINKRQAGELKLRVSLSGQKLTRDAEQKLDRLIGPKKEVPEFNPVLADKADEHLQKLLETKNYGRWRKD